MSYDNVNYSKNDRLSLTSWTKPIEHINRVYIQLVYDVSVLH